jgi:hypothetical protein
MLLDNFIIHGFLDSFERIVFGAMLWLFSCSMLYTRVVVNFMMYLLFKFGDNWPNSLGSMHVVRSVKLQFALYLPKQILEMFEFDLVNLWIILWYMMMKCIQFRKLSRMSLFMSIGVIELQLWIFLAAAVNLLEMRNFWDFVICRLSMNFVVLSGYLWMCKHVNTGEEFCT